MKIYSDTLIVIPVYNGEKFIKRSINSCLNQTLTSNIFIIDNCSTDNTIPIINEYVKNYTNIKLFKNKKNLGRIGNMNRCLDIFKKSGFKYLKFLFLGDELKNDSIERVEKVFLKKEDLSLVFTPYIFKESDGEIRLVNKIDKDVLLTKEELIKNEYFPFGKGIPGIISSNTFSKNAIKDLKFDEAFLGLISFSNKLINKGNIYHLNYPSCIFNKDSHSSYNKQFNYFFNLEVAFSRAQGLENNKNYFKENNYNSTKLNILKDLIISLSKNEPEVLKFLEFYVKYRKEN